MRENQWNDLLFFEIVSSHCFGASEAVWSEASKIDCSKSFGPNFLIPCWKWILWCSNISKNWSFLTRMWSACHKKSYLTNLEVRNLKSEISCLCPVWLSQFCLFWKKMGKGFVNIPKFVNSTHNKYLFLWHADHIKVEISFKNWFAQFI